MYSHWKVYCVYRLTATLLGYVHLKGLNYDLWAIYIIDSHWRLSYLIFLNKYETAVSELTHSNPITSTKYASISIN